MDWQSIIAVLCSGAGIYLLAVNRGTGPHIKIRQLSLPALPVTGVSLATTGLLLLFARGTGPAGWWNWELSTLAGRKPIGDAGIGELWRQHALFRVTSIVTVAGAVGVVTTCTPRAFRTALIVFSFSAALLFGIAADWPGMAILAATGLMAAGPFLRGQQTGGSQPAVVPDPDPKIAEPFLATAICVLVAWGLVDAIHRSATVEAGPTVADSDRVAAIPRAVRVVIRQANAERNDQSIEQRATEAWLLGISFGVVVMAGLPGVVRRTLDLRPGLTGTEPDKIT